MGEELTPQEIKALMDAGDLTPELAKTKLSPNEQAIYAKFASQQPPSMVPFKEGMRPNTPPDPMGVVKAGTAIGAGFGAASLPPAAIQTGLHYAKYGLGLAALDQLRNIGIPSSVVTGLEMALGMKAAMKGGPAAAAEGVVSAEEQAMRAGLEKQGYKGELLEKLMQGYKTSSGTKLPTGSSTPADKTFLPEPPQPRPYPPNVTPPSRPAEVDWSHVHGGVQNDFRGRVTFNGAKSAPPNVTNATTIEELLAMLEGPPKGTRTPLTYHAGDPQNIRSSVDKLKRRTGHGK